MSIPFTPTNASDINTLNSDPYSTITTSNPEDEFKFECLVRMCHDVMNAVDTVFNQDAVLCYFDELSAEAVDSLLELINNFISGNTVFAYLTSKGLTEGTTEKIALAKIKAVEAIVENHKFVVDELETAQIEEGLAAEDDGAWAGMGYAELDGTAGNLTLDYDDLEEDELSVLNGTHDFLGNKL